MATLYSSYFLYCETSIHAGDGTSNGTIDMPIQRERPTKFPNFRDSTLRGSVRESFETNEDLSKNALFKPTFGNKDDGDKNSALNVFPARLLFFPVRSFSGVFAYITCPYVLKRFVKDLLLLHKDITMPNSFSDLSVANENVIATNDLLITGATKIGLEEFLFENLSTEITINDKKIEAWFSEKTGVAYLEKHLAIVSDTVFKYFVNLYTEKITRNKIDVKTGTAQDQGLFNSEYLPEESILYTSFGFNNEFTKGKTRKKAKEIQDYFNNNLNGLLTLGGDKNIGKGILTPREIDFTLIE